MPDDETMPKALPRITGYRPHYQELVQGRAYAWCACGLSKSQPFCDGSHQGTGIEPVIYRAKDKGEEVLFCACKHTKGRPFCDGAHNNLLGAAGEDDPFSEANRQIPEVPLGEDGRFMLDGGCYVTRLERQRYETVGTLRLAPLIGGERGALYQSQFYGQAAPGMTPEIGFGDRHVILFTTGGDVQIEIGGQRFLVRAESGVYLRPNEAFRLTNEGQKPVDVFAAACPMIDAPRILDDLPALFDSRWPERVVPVDLALKQAMGERFFQMLVDKRIGADVVTQFIGEIPLSMALPHRHLYEESLIVLRGRGCMWTETKKAPVRAGDVIFLPRKQTHSLQCTDPDGMLVVGVIYPGDNPTINY
jgi:CDGSH-type Zn-finger protein/mannose-6-phosphate isomerase-like protein (cupin superfamily)